MQNTYFFCILSRFEMCHIKKYVRALAYMRSFHYLCSLNVKMIVHSISYTMKKIFSLIAVFLLSMAMDAGEYNLLWDYAEAPPVHNPDRGLSFSNTVNDKEGEKNGLKGIKLNSSGWCSFTKAPVAGQLRLTYGPRSGRNAASIQVFASAGEGAREVELVGTTCEVSALRTEAINLTAEQNTVYIVRMRNVETVLQRIEFVAGDFAPVAPCDPLDSPVPVYSPDMQMDSLSAETAFFLRALIEANKTGQQTIYLPNGVYDLGGMALTAIEANNISIIGESMEGTIIRNAPDYRYESIDKSATLRIAPGVEGTILANLTIENALDYYKDDNGRAVALWDQGTKTVCKNVRLLSHQDTYYSDREGGLKYLEDCEIHGTVDFICGDGNVYFKNCLLYCERRSKDGSGSDALTASGAEKSDKGYVFEGCTVKSECPVVSLGRSWKKYPKCVFLNTTLDFSAGVFTIEHKDIRRWTTQGMMALPEKFGEYRTMDKEGRILSPETNEITFHLDGKVQTVNTILTADEAAQYTIEYVLGEWAEEAKRVKIPNIIH